MSRIASVFNQSGHIALIPYVTVGYPSIEATLKVVPLLASSGCDIVELGIPFSDPLADGATIQKASFCALQNGITPQLCLEVAKQLSREVDIPLVFMTYFNPVLSYGLKEFCTACARCGVDGLIVPDLLPDEGSELEAITQGQDLDHPIREGGSYEASPHARLERLLRAVGVSAGLLFNGDAIRLVSAPRGESSGWIDFRVADMVQTAGRPVCAALVLLLSQNRLLTGSSDKRLPALLAESRKYQNQVSEQLAEQVLHALYELLRGLESADARAGGELLRGIRRKGSPAPLVGEAQAA